MPPEKTVRFERIVLTGFMGSGKSTVGRLLAEDLGWLFLDLDSAIEEKCGRSVPQIFAEQGEEQFRAIESAVLASAMQTQHMVLALGGGAPEVEDNRKLLKNVTGTAIFLLDAPFDTLHQRCAEQAIQSGATARPLLSDADVARQRYGMRAPLYRSVATWQIDTGGLSPKDAVDAIKLHLQ